MSSMTSDLSTRFARLKDVIVRNSHDGVLPQTPFPQPMPQFDHAPYTRKATSISTPAASVIPSVTSMTLTHGRSIPASEISPQNLVVLTLGDDELAVDRTTVPDPPSIVFSHDLSALFAAWHCSDALVVNGRGIPIKYWPLFYHAKNGIKGGAWKALRTIWGNWKVRLVKLILEANAKCFYLHYSLSSRSVKALKATLPFGTYIQLMARTSITQRSSSDWLTTEPAKHSKMLMTPCFFSITISLILAQTEHSHIHRGKLVRKC